MIKIFEILKSDFNKNVLTLMSGTIVGQFFLFLITPILSRIYSQQIFGYYFLFIGIINILKKVVTLRYELVIVVSKNEKEVFNALIIAFFINFSISILLFILTVIANLFLVDFNIGISIFIIPLTIFFIGIFEIFIYLNNKNKNYKRITIIRTLNNIINGTLQIIIIKISFLKLNGLIFGYSMAIIIVTIFLFFLNISYLKTNFKRYSFNTIKYLLIKHKKIPLYNTSINFVSNLSNELPVYLLAFLFGPLYAGVYGMANRIMGTPLDIVGQSIGNVFFQTAVDKYHTKKLNEFYVLSIKKIIRIGLIISFSILIITPFIDVILGKEWNNSKLYIIILLPAFLVNFINQPLTSLPTILKKQDIYLVYQIVFIVLKGISLFLGYILKNVYISLIFYSITCIVYRIVILRWFKKEVKDL